MELLKEKKKKPTMEAEEEYMTILNITAKTDGNMGW